MRLVVGGCGQGKLDWLRRHTGEAYGEAESVAEKLKIISEREL